MDFENDGHGYENPPDEERGYDRERSRSPRLEDHHRDDRARSASPNGREAMDTRGPPENFHARGLEEEEDANTAGTNLFVTGIHPSLDEQFIADLFGKHGRVEKCNIMRDPHTRDSRGFGFVNMVTSEDADAAKQALAGAVFEGRTMSIEKARRSRPRTPTPGQYLGPPKRDETRGPSRGRYRDRYDDRGYRSREDYQGGYRSSRSYGGGYDDRSSHSRRDAYGPRHIDRYASSRDYGYESRRGGGYYGRESRGGSYGSREPYSSSGGRPYETRAAEPRSETRSDPRSEPREPREPRESREDRYSRR
ncbi:MAG: nuA3 HAT complex component nto1 [Bathelium mastoideum]|nr:MAG: nuA3 HAT complex component nto1 [Bathelium mastoideum]